MFRDTNLSKLPVLHKDRSIHTKYLYANTQTGSSQSLPSAE